MIKLIDILLEVVNRQSILDQQQLLQRIGNWNFFKSDVSDHFEPSKFGESMEYVDIENIVSLETPQQSKLDTMGDYIERIPKDKWDTNFPIGIRYDDGKVYILDGHHRIELAKRAGKNTVRIAVKDMT